MKHAIAILKSEHRSISAVLQGLKRVEIQRAFAANADPVAAMQDAEVGSLFARIATTRRAQS